MEGGGGGGGNLKTATNNTTDRDSLPKLSDVSKIEYLMFTTLHPMRPHLGRKRGRAFVY